MKSALKTVCMVLTVVYVIFGMNAVQAAEKATKDEAVTKCKEAAQMIKDIGLEQTLAKLNDKNGPFVWKDSYVFSIDIESGLCTAHPFLPDAVGKDMRRNKDKEGKLYVVEFINTAKSKGEGWVSYMWPKPGEQQPLPKLTYVYRVPGHPVMLLSGVYE